MTDKNEYVESAAGRALHKSNFDLNKAYRLAIEFYKDISGIEPGDAMIQRIYSEVDLQFKNKNVIVPVKKQVDAAKVESYLRSKGE
jgi:predicted Mrr-cat superfamily restriction endonuclease